MNQNMFPFLENPWKLKWRLMGEGHNRLDCTVILKCKNYKVVIPMHLSWSNTKMHCVSAEVCVDLRCTLFLLLHAYKISNTYITLKYVRGLSSHTSKRCVYIPSE